MEEINLKIMWKTRLDPIKWSRCPSLSPIQNQQFLLERFSKPNRSPLRLKILGAGATDPTDTEGFENGEENIKMVNATLEMHQELQRARENHDGAREQVQEVKTYLGNVKKTSTPQEFREIATTKKAAEAETKLFTMATDGKAKMD